jgi:citrate lyase subunit beta/citryl-CoA lyase
MGLTWGAEDLATALGASTNLDSAGEWSFTYRLVRSLTLMAAHAAGVQAIETLSVDYRDEDSLLEGCRAARAEGFSGRIAIHPAQVAPVNAAYSPTPAEIGWAREVTAAYDTALAAGRGAVSVAGKMIDEASLRACRQVLDRARRARLID